MNRARAPDESASIRAAGHPALPDSRRPCSMRGCAGGARLLWSGPARAWLAAWLLAAAGLAGCASNTWIANRGTSGVSFVTPLHPFSSEELPRPSDRTMLLLRRYALAEDWQNDPSGLLAKLKDVVNREPTPDKIYSLSELAYLGGKRFEANDAQRALELYSAAVMHAYLYLFDERFKEQPNPYDPQFRGACDLYNNALEAAMRITHRQNGLVPGKSHTVRVANQTIEVVVVARGANWHPDDFERVEFVSDYELKGLQNHYHTYGLGVPLIAVRKSKTSDRPIERYYPKGLSFPVTAFLRMVPHQDGSPTHHVALLEFYDPLNATDLVLSGRRVPLETDLSTALAFALNQPELRDLDQPTMGLLRPESTEHAQGLYMLEPYQPGKIPVLMVHGVWSSPITWMEMFNDLRSSPEVRDRFQFWFYLYPTAQPFWFSAAQLRADLAKMRQNIDPYHQEAALDQMVLVGHSMGGLVGALQTIDSGDEFWKIVSREPFQNLKASPELRESLAQTLFFQANPSIRQVIFIGTPHRGSAFANDTLRWVMSRAISLPKMFAGSSHQLHHDNPSFYTSGNLVDVTTSIDSLAPSCPIFPVMLRAPHAPTVHYHNINGRIPDTFLQRVSGGDGVVTLESAHLDGIDSEIVVPSEHQVLHRHPLTVLEVRRILLEHAASLRAAPAAPLSAPHMITGPTGVRAPQFPQQSPQPQQPQPPPAAAMLPGQQPAGPVRR